jgi:hypothetical protein
VVSIEIFEATGKYRSDIAVKDRAHLAVWRWPRTGIPDVHWPVVMRLVPSLSADDLLQLNMVARKSWAEKRAKSAA